MYTVEQIANMFGVRKSTVRRWIKDGELKATEQNGKFVIGESDLIEFEALHHYDAVVDDSEYRATINALLFGAKEEHEAKAVGNGNPEAPHKKVTLTVSETEDIR